MSTPSEPKRLIDARRFLQRGRSLLDAVVLIAIDRGDRVLCNGLRITADLVVALPAGADLDNARVTIDEGAVDVVWAGPNLLVLRTPRYEGSLPELSLRSYAGYLSLLYVSPSGEARLGFGRTLDGPMTHDAPSEPGSMGAPLFDDAWAVIGLHQARDAQETSTLVPISQLTRELEESPCWDEISAVHRLVPSMTKMSPMAAPSDEPDLARAVRWRPDEKNPMSERERRRAIAGATLAQLRAARGKDPASTPEQRAVDTILAAKPYTADSIGDDILLPFATAARWFRGVVPGLPDEATLERDIRGRRQKGAIVAIAGSHFAPRKEESQHLMTWLGDPGRRPMVVRGPGGIGKSALLAHFILETCPPARFAWIDLDRPDVSADEATISRVVDEHLSWQTGDGALVVVLDSFETSVQTYGYTNLNPALDALARRFDNLAVVVGSRAPVPLLKVQGEAAEEWELPGLAPDVVTNWLVEEGIPQSIANDIATVANGVPLNMRLARDLVKGKSEAEARTILASLPKQLVTGYLYRRILRRLRDETLKEQAQWAMVPRRLVPELLGEVLHVSRKDADLLFAALRRELTLLEGDTVLAIRPDLRNTLLPLLEADDAERVREIDRIAADFWSKRTGDDADAAEAIYHALRLADVERADKLWRRGAARYLRGYTGEEIPPRSRSWLESRVAHESVDQRVESLVTGGQFTEARTALEDQPKGVGTLSAGTRRRKVLGFAEALNVAVPDEQADTTAVESIILSNARPAVRIRNGTFDIETPAWSHLAAQRPAIVSGIAAVGRVQLGSGTVAGTASLVGDGLFLTTRSVVEAFVVGSGHDVKLVTERGASVDMDAEGEDPQPGRAGGEIHAITRVVLVHPYWDIAIFEAASLKGRKPLALETSEPAAAADVVVIGHPSETVEERDLVGRIFDNVFEVKRLMPGSYQGLQPELSYGRQVKAGGDDASALSRDYGAAVIDPATGRLVGVRFLSVFLTRAAFVPAWELARDPEIAKAGVNLAGAPAAAPEWVSTWTAVTTPRHQLLDAYLAMSSNDFTRARALLELIPSMGTPTETKIERTLLEAACDLETDRSRAGDLLHQLVAETPDGAWPAADRDAAIATRLRLAVDAEAECTFLELLQNEPFAAGLISPRLFRVLVPPGDLKWNYNAAPLQPNRPDADDLAKKRYSPEAIAAAWRISTAANRCLQLEPWIASYARELANLDYILSRSLAEARELTAAYVAYPAELVRHVAQFLLDKTDLAPHPTKGWEPIVLPLWMMFRESGGRFPDNVKDRRDVVTWLKDNEGSSRLGSYLSESFRFQTDVAWSAGLLHLTTPLPIESLLRRRFSAGKP